MLAQEEAPGALAAENERLAERVRELEHLLHLERSRNKGLERGLSALSQRASRENDGQRFPRRVRG
jgi:hypothetical protein